MKYTIIEISDIGVRIWKNGEVICDSPGYIHFNAGNMLFGDQALANSRLQPQGVRSHHFSRLNLQRFTRPTKMARHEADLVYRQLEKLIELFGKLENVVLIVPSTLSKEQLSLLLGIMHTLKIDVHALIDRSILSVANVGLKELQFLDLELHRSSLITVSVTEQIKIESKQTFERFGKEHFDDICVRWVADCFLGQARFDPLAHAETEQMVFDQLAGWLQQFAQNQNINANLEFHGHRYEVSLLKEAFIAAIKPQLDSMLSSVDRKLPVVVSPRFAPYPLELISDVQFIRLKPTEIFETANRYLSHIVSSPERVVYVTGLPFISNHTAASTAHQS